MTINDYFFGMEGDIPQAFTDFKEGKIDEILLAYSESLKFVGKKYEIVLGKKVLQEADLIERRYQENLKLKTLLELCWKKLS